jgi:cysteinyl-tRNA synthetase
MDDDLGTPAAVAVIYDTVREANRLAEASEVHDGRPVAAAQVRAMLDVLGLDPADPAWPSTGGGPDTRMVEAVDALVQGLLAERAGARAAKDWSRADAIRDQIKAAGIEIEDTPAGPVWTLGEDR